MEHKGAFSILQWDENTVSENDSGIKISHASIKQRYDGSMVGESQIEYLMRYENAASAKFTGFETFVGVIDGLRGSFTLEHRGNFAEGVAKSEFTVIASSVTGELSGKHISGAFQSGEAGKGSYTIFVTEQ